ncbi:hypothetical protein ACFWY5_54815 [Nonomuraea sp. NPDC059007]|uniref:hypothetical protein n=1 Tax=Nonomuraea sp. NPDC059007 TaxID=3346692 RepID=UPI0036D0C143
MRSAIDNVPDDQLSQLGQERLQPAAITRRMLPLGELPLALMIARAENRTVPTSATAQRRRLLAALVGCPE